MTTPTRRQVVLVAVAVAILLAVVYAFRPQPIPVSTVAVSRGPLHVVVEEEGETRLEDRYVITAPVAAFVRRIELEEGDVVRQGQVVARLAPPRAPILDPRTQAQAQAAVRAAAAAVDDATVVAERAAADRDRAETLHAAGAISGQALEQARAAATRAAAAVDAARAELAAARAAAGTGGASGGVPATVTAPAAGRVLAVHQRSEGHVNPGTPLLEVGDTRRLEIRADVLSQDAVRIAAGTRVIVDQWGGADSLEAVVTRVEPQGTTTISALGVEEQRVTVRANLTSPPDRWAGLGSGYRVLARFVVWEADGVLQVPSAALFRSGDGWAVFVVVDGVAAHRAVRVGQQAGLAAQIVDGLTEGDRVVVHPPNELADGARVSVREDRE